MSKVYVLVNDQDGQKSIPKHAVAFANPTRAYSAAEGLDRALYDRRLESGSYRHQGLDTDLGVVRSFEEWRVEWGVWDVVELEVMP